MEILNKKVQELKGYSNNPRKNAQAIEAVANCIKEFGFLVPIVIDTNNIIVAGHTRLKAAQKLEMQTVPCILADDLTPEQIRAFRLVDNKVGELADWKFDKLEQELAEINIDMGRFGFEDENITIEPTEEADDNFDSDMVTMSFQLHEKQKELIEQAMQEVQKDICETFGNPNKNGNAIHEVVRQWAAGRESNEDS